MNAIDFGELRRILAEEGDRQVLLALPSLGEVALAYALQHLRHIGDPEEVARRCMWAHVVDWLGTVKTWEDDLLSGLPEDLLHTFACDVAERALLREREAGREPDPRSWKAIKTKRAWIQGKATDAELDAASSAAWDAASSAARSAASSAAWSAASSAAWYAARSAAWDAALDAARYAAWYAARSAALDAAWDAERDWQKEHLAQLVEGWEE